MPLLLPDNPFAAPSTSLKHIQHTRPTFRNAWYVPSDLSNALCWGMVSTTRLTRRSSMT